MVDKIRNLKCVKFAFGKQSEFFNLFSKNTGAYCMYDDGYGLNVPEYLSLENQLRVVFKTILDMNGVFLFNVSGVDIRKAMKGFVDFDEAYGDNLITEWELSIILRNEDYKKVTIFHNGVNEFVFTKNGIKIKWN